MAFEWTGFFDLAQELASQPNASNHEALCRTVASRAYYACFHASQAVAKQRGYWPEVEFAVPAAGETRAVGTSEQHGGQPGTLSSTNLGYHERLIAWLGQQGDPNVVALADSLRDLKVKREWADYHPRHFTLADANKVLSRAGILLGRDLPMLRAQPEGS